MTEHEKAILKALIDLEGTGTNKQIYELAKQYAMYNGSTPNNTIRRDLQQSSFVRPVEGTKGVWELVPYNKISEAKDKQISDLQDMLDKERQKIKHLKEQLEDANTFSRLAVMYMKAEVNKSQDKREGIKNWLLDMTSELHIILPYEVSTLINHFDDVMPPKDQIVKIYNASSHSADIEITGLNKEQIQELLQKKI